MKPVVSELVAVPTANARVICDYCLATVEYVFKYPVIAMLRGRIAF